MLLFSLFSGRKNKNYDICAIGCLLQTRFKGSSTWGIQLGTKQVGEGHEMAFFKK